jgi:hypothetical protein
VVAGIGFHPVLIIVGALAENFLAHDRKTKDRPNEMNDLFGPGKPAQITVDHHPVKTVIYKDQQAAKQPCERLHRSSPYALVLT